MDEAEQDIRIIQTEVSVTAEAKPIDNADRGLNNSDILRKPNSIIILLFIPQQKQFALSVETEAKRAEAAEAIVKTK